MLYHNVTSRLERQAGWAIFGTPREVLHGQKQQPICLSAENQEDQEEWIQALSHSRQACSLSLEGLNLECGHLSDSGRLRKRGLGSRARERLIYQRLELLNELRRDTDGFDERQLPCSSVVQQVMADIDNKYDRALIAAQRDAMRRATYLRQRKISTQIKMETLQKQLQENGSAKKTRPISLPENPASRKFFEEQLEELAHKLQAINSTLGLTEKQAEAALRKLDIRREEELRGVQEEQQLRWRRRFAGQNRDSDSSHQPQQGAQSSVSSSSSSKECPRICISRSEEDCRAGSSSTLVSRATKFLSSPRLRKGSGDVRSNSASNLSATGSIGSGSVFGLRREEEDQHRPAMQDRLSDDIHPVPSFQKDSSSTSSSSTSTGKTRKGPLKLLGNFVDSHLLRGRLYAHKRNKSADLGTLRSNHSADIVRCRSRTADEVVTTTTILSDPGSPYEFTFLRGSEARSLSNSSGADSDEGGGTPTSSDRSEESVSRQPQLGPQRRNCFLEEKMVPRTEINPAALAEIEAFERMAQNYLRVHGQEFPV